MSRYSPDLSRVDYRMPFTAAGTALACVMGGMDLVRPVWLAGISLRRHYRGRKAGCLLALHRVAYDFRVPIAKTRKAGLLPRSELLPPYLRTPLKRGARILGLAERLKRLGW